MKKLLAVSCMGAAITASSIVSASPALDVTPTLLSRGTYEPFKLKTEHDSPVDFEAKAKSPLDVLVREHDYKAGASTGWHTHPAPVFITVVKGTLTFYEYDDPTCTPKVVTAGQGYVDSGHGHIALNRSNEEAIDVSVILAPVGLPFRGELPAPNPYCGF
jgi:hypothetical protein